MPGCKAWYAASYAVIDTFAASRIRVISCSLLIMRHPAVTGVALAICRAGTCRGDSVAEYVRSLFLDSQHAGTDSQVSQSLGYSQVGIFVLLPGSDLSLRAKWTRSPVCSRARPSSNAGHTKNAFPLAGSTMAKKPLAQPPVNGAVVGERAAVRHDNGLQLVLRHQLAGPLHSAPSLVDGDWSGLVLHRLQTGDRGRQLGVASRRQQ